jgi:hypothetical protein
MYYFVQLLVIARLIENYAFNLIPSTFEYKVFFFLGGEIWAVSPYLFLSVPAEVHLRYDALTDKKGRHGTVRSKIDSCSGVFSIEISAYGQAILYHINTDKYTHY